MNWKDIEEKKVRDILDIPCPKCGSTGCDWTSASFREWLQSDYCIFDSTWHCEKCGHDWEATMDFKAAVVTSDESDEDGCKVEYEITEE